MFVDTGQSASSAARGCCCLSVQQVTTRTRSLAPRGRASSSVLVGECAFLSASRGSPSFEYGALLQCPRSEPCQYRTIPSSAPSSRARIE